MRLHSPLQRLAGVYLLLWLSFISSDSDALKTCHTLQPQFFFIQVCTLQLPPEMNPLLVVFLCSLMEYCSSVSASIFSISGPQSQLRARSLLHRLQLFLKKLYRIKMKFQMFQQHVYTLQFQLYLVLKDYSTNVPTILFNIFGSCFNRHFNFHLCFNPCTCFSLKGLLIVLFNISGTTSTSLVFSWSLILFKCINFQLLLLFQKLQRIKNLKTFTIFQRWNFLFN